MGRRGNDAHSGHPPLQRAAVIDPLAALGRCASHASPRVRCVALGMPFVLIGALTAGCELGQPGPPARAVANPAPPSGTWSADTAAAWAAMQERLAGEWVATTAENRTINVAYRVISNGSALVETWTSQSGKETVSVYHPDGNALMLTHYCAQGNQARLRATEATGERIVFRYVDATNVTGEQGIMQSLAFTLRADGFDQVSEYLSSNGERDATTLRFSRAAP